MEENAKKEKPKADKAKTPGRLQSFFNDIRGEGRKIIWPSRTDLKNKTITVIFTSLLFAAIIFCIDSVYNVGLQLFAAFLS